MVHLCSCSKHVNHKTSKTAWRMVVNIPCENALREVEDPPLIYADVSNELASLDCGRIAPAVLDVKDYGQHHCAVKLFDTGHFNDFRVEIEEYQKLAGKPFLLKFFGAFCGFVFDQPYGVIVTEDNIGKSFTKNEEISPGQA